jgi:hypothetical protein
MTTSQDGSVIHLAKIGGNATLRISFSARFVSQGTTGTVGVGILHLLCDMLSNVLFADCRCMATSSQPFVRTLAPWETLKPQLSKRASSLRGNNRLIHTGTKLLVGHLGLAHQYHESTLESMSYMYISYTLSRTRSPLFRC